MFVHIYHTVHILYSDLSVLCASVVNFSHCIGKTCFFHCANTLAGIK
jgi:hypothetical protein